jgi:bifunctional ADP-heptose synthase (sugar kinase/adenylyltransferase)
MEMNETLTSTVLRVIERAPQWVRHDLESKDAALRVRAEETLAAMIAAALNEVSAYTVS